MDEKFWIKAWEDGRTNFHQSEFNSKLLRYFPQLIKNKGQKVLVPLCGKTKDMIWLHQMGLKVHGIELYEEAVLDFFRENGLGQPEFSKSQEYLNYSLDNYLLRCGDFFKLQEKDYDLVYDRAALIALPAAMRVQYAEVIKASVLKGGQCLLITLEYDQTQLEGPPFNVSKREVATLFEDSFSIELLESAPVSQIGPRFAALSTLSESVFVLTKK